MELQNLLSGPLAGMISQQLGTDQNQTASAVGMAMPVILGALSKNASNSAGADSLHKALSSSEHDGNLLDNLDGFMQKSQAGSGANILKHVLGQNRGNVESAISQNSGLNTQATSQVFEMLAPVLMGVLGKQQRQQGLGAGGLGTLLNSLQGQANKAVPTGQSSMIEKLLDQNGDGSIIDDVAGIGMKLLGGFLKGK